MDSVVKINCMIKMLCSKSKRLRTSEALFREVAECKTSSGSVLSKVSPADTEAVRTGFIQLLLQPGEEPGMN